MYEIMNQFITYRMKISVNFFANAFRCWSLHKTPSIQLSEKTWKFTCFEIFGENIMTESLGIMNCKSIPFFIKTYDIRNFIITKKHHQL